MIFGCGMETSTSSGFVLLGGSASSSSSSSSCSFLAVIARKSATIQEQILQTQNHRNFRMEARFLSKSSVRAPIRTAVKMMDVPASPKKVVVKPPIAFPKSPPPDGISRRFTLSGRIIYKSTLAETRLTTNITALKAMIFTGSHSLERKTTIANATQERIRK